MVLEKISLDPSVKRVIIMSDFETAQAMKSGGKNTHLMEIPRKFEFLTYCHDPLCDFTIKNLLTKKSKSAQ